MGPARGLAGLEHLVQVRCPGGEHVDAVVQVAVAGGHRDGEVAGEDLHVGVVAEPAQHQQRLVAGGGGAGAEAGAPAATLGEARPREFVEKTSVPTQPTARYAAA